MPVTHLHVEAARAAGPGRRAGHALILAWPKRARHSHPHFAASGAIHTITFC